MKVDSFQKNDSVKTYAKSKLDIIRQNTKTDSTVATKRVWIIVGLISIQLFFLTKAFKRKSV